MKAAHMDLITYYFVSFKVRTCLLLTSMENK